MWVDPFIPRRGQFSYYSRLTKNPIECDEGQYCCAPRRKLLVVKAETGGPTALGFGYLDGLHRALDFASPAKDAVRLPGRVRFPDR